MNYVFFDIECANCIHGEGKICSFGFVKTDENFNVIQEHDLLRNPDAPFLLGNAKTGKGITLAYPLFRFRESPIFPHYYKQIRKLLTNPDTLCFGFAVNQDASFISYSCARYHLPYIDFKFFDIQEFEKRLFHRKNASGLQSLIEQYGEGAFTYHRSEDDALRTREVFKHRVKNLGQTVEQIWNRYPECINDTRTLNAHILEQKKARLAKQRRILRMNNFYSLPSPNANINCYSKLLWGKKFFFTTKVLKNKKCRDILFQKRDRFFKKGGILVKDYPDADYVVLHSSADKERAQNEHPEATFITFDEIRKEIG